MSVAHITVTNLLLVDQNFIDNGSQLERTN